jgi:Putative prokaryotic signal transducing protein
MAQDLVTVATFTTATDAHLHKNLLEGEGIQAFVADELTGDQLSGAYLHGYVKLQVSQQNVERAQQILRAREQDRS